MAGVVAATGLFSAFFVLNNRRREAGLDESLNDVSHDSVKLTCVDVGRLMEDYFAATELEPDHRSVMQKDLIIDFEWHLANCNNCPKIVAEARKNA